MYDSFSSDYDRFVNWQSRLAFEMPLIEKLVTTAPAADRPLRVLDAACGTGMHAIELARRSFSVSGADLSEGMIEHARDNAKNSGVNIRFEVAGFGGLVDIFGEGDQDAIVCLGNSLPHVLNLDSLQDTLADFAACLRPGGILIVQNRNYDKLVASRERWMEPQSHGQGADECIFLRFYDYLPDGLINFNILTLKRQGAGWLQTRTSTPLFPLLYRDLAAILADVGFGYVLYFGSMDGSPYNPLESDNLIIAAVKD